MKLLSSSYRISVWLLYLCLFSCSTGSLNQSVAPSRLSVISEIKRHKGTVKLDSSQAMVRLEGYLTPLFTDFKYADRDNFTQKILYRNPLAFLRLPVAKALGKVQNELKTKGLAVKIWDAYRPYSVTKKMWAIVPDERYAANPAKGSGHNRGAAVDLTLVYLKTGKELKMPTPFDNFTENAHHSYQQLDKEVIDNRNLLRSVMEKYGFVALETEWWHYSWPNAANLFPVLDLSFDDLSKAAK
jgi:D-alanyl-D-alanine dipeptidase